MIRPLRQLYRRLRAHPRYAALLQFARFSLVGVSNTLLSLGFYYLFLYALGWHYQLANAVSFFLSVVNAYVWNSRFVFSTARDYGARQHMAAFGKSLLSYGGAFLLNALLLWLLVDGLGISDGLAPVPALLITYPANYLLHKYWAFRQRKSGAPDDRQKGAQP